MSTLLSLQGEVGEATSLLISMGESMGESKEVEHEEVTGSLAWVAATVLGKQAYCASWRRRTFPMQLHQKAKLPSLLF